MTDANSPLGPLTPTHLATIDDLCLEFEQGLDRDVTQRAESFLARLPTGWPPEARARAIVELIAVEYFARQAHDRLELDEAVRRFPDQRGVLEDWFRQLHNPTLTSLVHDAQSTSPDRTARLAYATRLVELIQEYEQLVGSGQTIDQPTWIAEHAEFAEPLRRAVEGLDLVRSLRQATDRPNADPRIGDFRILREIGRGGMGTVFEAEQISLRRRVALKILWFQDVSDREAVQRFRREASTVAQLHHTHIVPIFSIGQEGHVNYYAMQLIDGRGLDTIIKEHPGGCTFDDVAQWGRQAAEALAHAHTRGVVHRDVKPSNLLLDRHGQIWLTDFGLAKRADDVTLSVAGTVLGTPRYMSPEQASASLQSVDHRSDIYSLGATLYELATGHPVFQASTAQGVIHQILTREPADPSSLRPNLPRDLNTILLKCLAKEPDKRYTEAQELADDLRAFLDRRPITARRPAVWQRLGLWARRQRKAVRLASLTATATVLLIGFLVLVAYLLHRSRLAQVQWKTTLPPVVLSVATPAGSVVVPPITIPTQQPIDIPAGRAVVTAQADGLLSQDYQLDLFPREQRELQLRPDAQLLAPILRDRHYYDTVHRGDGADVLSFDQTHLVVEDPGAPAASRLVARYDLTSILAERAPGWLWPPEKIVGVAADYAGKSHRQPWVLAESLDVNHDQQGDYIVAFRHQACIAAFDRQQGLLWARPLAADVAETRSASDAAQGHGYTPRSTIVQMPQTIADLDGDGTYDLLVHVAHINPRGTPRLENVERSIVALSGATGVILWRLNQSQEWYKTADSTSVPYAMAWFVGMSSGTRGAGSSSWTSRAGRPIRNLYGGARHTGDHVAVGHLHCWIDEGQTHVWLQAGAQLIEIDVAQGQIRGAYPLEFFPALPARLAPFDQQPGQDLLLVHEAHSAFDAAGLPRYQQPSLALHCWSPKRRAAVWQASFTAMLPATLPWHTALPTWPSCADLDRDQRCEILLPTRCRYITNPGALDQDALQDFSVIDGATGRIRWTQSILHADQQLDWAVAGPDIDGDHVDEVFVANLAGTPLALYVDAWSGATGQSLWVNRTPLASPLQGHNAFLSELSWWHRDDLAASRLAVSIQSDQPGGERFGELVAIGAATGNTVHRAHPVHGIQIADLDGDRAEDLCLLRDRTSVQSIPRHSDWTMIRGTPNESWRALGAAFHRVTDLDGDTCEDLVRLRASSIEGISSKSADVLWTFRRPAHGGRMSVISRADLPREVSPSESSWDFDQDGTSDLLLCPEPRGLAVSTLQAVSGRSGRTLWTGPHDFAWNVSPAYLTCRDLDDDNQGEIFYVGARPWPPLTTSANSVVQRSYQFYCACYSSHTGAIRWSHDLSTPQTLAASSHDYGENVRHDAWVETPYDCDGDGHRDWLAPADVDLSTKTFRAILALSGRDGHALWRYTLPAQHVVSGNLAQPPRLAIPRSRGSIQRGLPLAILDFVDATAEDGTARREACITCLNSRTGATLWNWRHDVEIHSERSSEPPPRRLHQWVRQADQADRLVVQLVVRGESRIFLLDATGKLLTELPLRSRPYYGNRGLPLWVGDVDHDEVDEVFAFDPVLTCWQVRDTLTARATFPVNYDEHLAEVDIDESSDHSSTHVVIRRHDQPSIASYAGATSALLWKLQGPFPSEAIDVSEPPVRPLRDATGQVAAALFASGDLRTCHNVPSRVRVNSLHAPNANDPVVADHTAWAHSRASDLRLVRQLPWMREWQFAETRRQVIVRAGGSLLYSIVLILAPLQYVRLMWQQRAFSVSWLLLAPAITGLALALLAAPILDGQQGVGEKFALGLLSTPFVWSLCAWIRSGVAGKWRQLALWAGITGVIQVGLSILGVVQDLHYQPWCRGERFDWSGWYGLLPHALLATAYLYCLRGLGLEVWRATIGRRPEVRDNETFATDD